MVEAHFTKGFDGIIDFVTAGREEVETIYLWHDRQTHACRVGVQVCRQVGAIGKANTVLGRRDTAGVADRNNRKGLTAGAVGVAHGEAAPRGQL